LNNFKINYYFAVAARCTSGHVVECWTCMGSIQIPTMAAVYQCQLIMLLLQGQLMSNSENWAVNEHTTRCTRPVFVVFGFSWCLTEGYMKWRSVLPYGPMRLWKDFALFALWLQHCS